MTTQVPPFPPGDPAGSPEEPAPPHSFWGRLLAPLRRLRDTPTRWITFGVLTGVLSGLAAVVFFVGLEATTHLVFTEMAGVTEEPPPGDRIFTTEPTQDPRPWLLILFPAIGGLISGWLVWRYAPEAAGHGIDEMLRAFHRGRGLIRPRVPLVKGLATVATISTGGSAGKEGPISQIGAGIGSVLATHLGLSARDRRILLLAGAAGGLGAIFRAPLGSAITAIEVLYHEDFESDALVPCVLSSVSAYVVFVTMVGGARIFDVPSLPLVMPREILGYLLLSLLAVPVGRLYIRLFYAARDQFFSKLPLHRALVPVLGGLGVGLIGFYEPAAYGSGWGTIQRALDGSLLWQAMAIAAAAKIAATCLTIGSGGSGGVFGPTLFIGGMIGGFVGFGGQELFPSYFRHPEAYVLVGMGSFFAGVASAPIGAMLMVAEMTGGYTLLPPLMLSSVCAILLMRRTSIYQNQVADRFHSPAHVGDLTINVLEEMKVSDLKTPAYETITVHSDTSFAAVRDLVLESRIATVPVLDHAGKLSGLVTAEQIRPVMDERQLDGLVVAGDIAAPAVWVEPDDDLYRAHELFRACGCPQIPVVQADENEQPQIVGMLDYRDMMAAYGRELTRRRESAS